LSYAPIANGMAGTNCDYSIRSARGEMDTPSFAYVSHGH